MPSGAFCGRNRALVYTAGGLTLVGELEGAFSIRWQRIRDDISTAQVSVSLTECCDVLEQVHCVTNELHIYRDDALVWCGPITRLEFEWDRCDIFAEDMLWVAKRRALNYGYNLQDPPNGDGPVNAIAHMHFLLSQCYFPFAMDPWSMTGRLHPVYGPEDPDTGRQANAWSTTIWAEFDITAEDYGTDYAVVGRDIYYFDHHYKWNTIEPLAPEDIADYPRLVEYGNSVATRFVRTDGSGMAGIAEIDVVRRGTFPHPIDVVSNENSQAEIRDPDKPPTATDIARWQRTAEKQIQNHWPIPRSIIVPANSTLMPTSPWDIATLMPGCWFDVSIDRLCRGTVHEFNRLHELNVEETGEGGEVVRVTTIPPPNTPVEDTP